MSGVIRRDRIRDERARGSIKSGKDEGKIDCDAGFGDVMRREGTEVISVVI